MGLAQGLLPLLGNAIDVDTFMIGCAEISKGCSALWLAAHKELQYEDIFI